MRLAGHTEKVDDFQRFVVLIGLGKMALKEGDQQKALDYYRSIAAEIASNSKIREFFGEGLASFMFETAILELHVGDQSKCKKLCDQGWELLGPIDDTKI